MSVDRVIRGLGARIEALRGFLDVASSVEVWTRACAVRSRRHISRVSFIFTALVAQKHPRSLRQRSAHGDPQK